MDSIQQAALALQQEWGLRLAGTATEEEILQQLAERIAQLAEKGQESFFQLMYRLDISEKKLRGTMHQPDVAMQIARLIYDRQLQKIRSREYYKTHPLNEDPDLKW